MTAVGAALGCKAPLRKSILVVACFQDERNRLADWLEEEGYDVMTCPGPREPTVCPQIQGQRCPLSHCADAVVLDVELEGDLLGAGPPGWVLVDTYLRRGSKVLALVAPSNAPPVLNRPVMVLSRSAGPAELRGAVGRLLG